MTTPEERWWSLRAGEYVLGTLRGRDLELFDRILAHDTAIQGEVARWERHLHGLNETALDRPPAAHVWPAILERTRLPVASQGDASQADASQGGASQGDASQGDASQGDASQADASQGDIGAGVTPSVDPVRGTSRRKRSGRSRFGRSRSRPTSTSTWRGIAGLATAASLVLAFLLFQRVETDAPMGLSTDGVAVVLSDEDGAPYFFIETDYDEGRVRVTALAPPALEADRNFQLWQALPDRSAVRAVALLPEESGRSRVFEVTTLIEGSDLFGVSLEPVGAPTDAGPTGPVVAHGDFVETRPGH